MIQRYKKESFTQFRQSHNGWIVGAFFPPDSIQHSEEVEIRHGIIQGKEFAFTAHYHSHRTSYILVLKGEIIMKFDGELTTVSAGEFAIFMPGVTEEGVSAQPGTEVVIVRTPSSAKEDKVEMKK